MFTYIVLFHLWFCKLYHISICVHFQRIQYVLGFSGTVMFSFHDDLSIGDATNSIVCNALTRKRVFSSRNYFNWHKITRRKRVFHAKWSVSLIRDNDDAIIFVSFIFQLIGKGGKPKEILTPEVTKNWTIHRITIENRCLF